MNERADELARAAHGAQGLRRRDCIIYVPPDEPAHLPADAVPD